MGHDRMMLPKLFSLEVVIIPLRIFLYTCENVLIALMKETCSWDSAVDMTQTSREGHVAF